LLRKWLGDDGLRKLLIDQQAQIVPQQEMVVEAMARGTAWIGLGPYVGTLIKPYQDAGLKVNVRAFGNDPGMTEQSIGGAGLYVFNKPPHPNATSGRARANPDQGGHVHRDPARGVPGRRGGGRQVHRRDPQGRPMTLAGVARRALPCDK
jgi:hypothetical protein